MATNNTIDRINLDGDVRIIKPGAENVRVSNVLIGGEDWTPGNVQTALENLRNYVKDNATQIAGLSGKTDLVFGSVINDGAGFEDINGDQVVPTSAKLYIDISTGIIYRWGANSFEQVGGKDLGEYSLKNVPFLENPDTSNPDVFNIYKTYEDYVAWLRDHSASRLMTVAELLAYLDANIGQYVLALDAASSPEYVQRLSAAGGIATQSSATTYIELRSHDNSPGLKISFSIDRTATNTGTTLTAERSTGITTASYNGNTKVNEVSIAPAGVLTKLANGTTTNYILPSSSGTLALQSEVAGKQDALVSGQNIKSINGQSVLGSGDLELGELFVVRMTRNNSNSVYTADKSVSEIYTASYTNGKPVIAVMRDINNPVFILSDCDPDGDSYVFSAIESNTVTTLRWKRTDDYTYELETMVLQPHLVSGTSIKTVNNESLLGGGNVDIVGKSAYQSYVDTTADSPVKTEAEWVASLKGEDGVSLGEVAVADNLTTDDGTKVLSARQGYLLGQKVNVVDDVPTAGSEKFVKSGGVQNELALGAVYDVSAKNTTAGTNNDGKFESLSALLSDNNLNTLIPISVRKGGMSIKFVQSSDNKYVQYRLMNSTWSMDTADWASFSEDVLVYNPEFVKVVLDKEKKILWAIKSDGTIYYGAGVPSQVVDYIQQKIDELSLDEYEDVVTFLGNLIEGDKTLSQLLAKKVSIVEGKSLINEEYANSISYEYNPEYVKAEIDKNRKFIIGYNTKGEVIFGVMPPQIREAIDSIGKDNTEETLYCSIKSFIDREELKNLILQGKASGKHIVEGSKELSFTVGASVSDDDTMDYWNGYHGGFYSTLFPVCASIGIPACESVECWRNGIVFEGALNTCGKVMKTLVNKAGWEALNHTSTTRFNAAIAFDTWEDAMDAITQGTLVPVSGTSFHPNFNTQIYIRDKKVNYTYVNNNWEITPSCWIRPMLSNVSGTYIADNPTFPYEFQINVSKRLIEKFMDTQVRTYNPPASSYSARIMKEALVNHRYILKSFRFVNSTGDTRIALIKALTINKLPLENLIYQWADFDGGESDTDNTDDGTLYNLWKTGLNDLLANGSKSINLTTHLYRPCWKNEIAEELVSNGGTYPDEWVRPVKNPEDIANAEDYDLILLPKESTGLVSWGNWNMDENENITGSGWHPCPGTRLYSYWKFLLYMKSKGIVFSTFSDNMDRMRNTMCLGFKPTEEGYGLAPYDSVNQEYYIVGMDGSIVYNKL